MAPAQNYHYLKVNYICKYFTLFLARLSNATSLHFHYYCRGHYVSNTIHIVKFSFYSGSGPPDCIDISLLETFANRRMYCFWTKYFIIVECFVCLPNNFLSVSELPLRFLSRFTCYFKSKRCVNRRRLCQHVLGLFSLQSLRLCISSFMLSEVVN